MSRVLGAGLLLLVLLPQIGAAANGESSGLQRRAAELRRRLADIEESEAEVLSAMEALEELLVVETAALARAEDEVRDTRAALSIIEADIVATRERLERCREALEPRLVARYRLGDMGYLPVILSAGSVPEFLSLRKMLGRIVQADIEAMREVRRLASLLEQQRTSLEDGRQQLEELRAAAASRLSALQQTKREREEALALIREDRVLQQRALAQVNSARRDLERRMAGMARDGARDRGFASLRGRLPRPVPGAVTTGFGSRERGETGQTIHRGVDIRAPRGTPVRAVAQGRVAHADWLRGYGNLVILDHGGGFYTLMAHLERTEVSVGDEVSAGQTVGLVGDSGSFDGAHLYFEIRRGAQALDPERWFSG